MNFLNKWEDGSAPGLEAESFFTGEEKFNENHPVPREPFPQGQERGCTVHVYGVAQRDKETFPSHTAGRWAGALAGGRWVQDLLGRGKARRHTEDGDVRGVTALEGGHLALQRLL